ncbi:terminase large subunit [Paracholeplasma manati]|uniref:terminase large subunit n=1 Tax=Paracholeplasma manati TaxID=591373 RepID=UPI0024085160|nr:terminase TerL endonuclease subunit [Paracholeplasma manati]MDG0889214.1 terminase large subunit [Paracholeplasma manati]
MNYLIEYYQKVMSNEILAGEELKSTLRKLMDDMVNPRYDFDEKPGNMRIDFIETFCKHTKSPFNGQPFILELWEKAIIQTAYGFKITETGLRRFNEVILLIARKNGKTTFIAGIDLAEFFLSKGGVDIVCASNTSEQANILFEEINNMREQSPALLNEKRSKKNIFFIYSPKTKNKIKKLSAQSRNKDGYNIEVGCIDEVHEMTDSKVYDAIKQSQSTKKEPLIFIITTEGTTVGGFLDNKLDYARKMLKGEITDERVLPWLYTQDNTQEIYDDPKNWVKSNPSLGVVKLSSYLEDVMNKSKNDHSTRVTMLCKDFNIKQVDQGAWLSFDDLNNEAKYELSTLKNSYAIAGVDLSSTTDLTAAILVIQKKDDNKKYVLAHFFMPSDVVKKRMEEDNVPYDIWIKRGLITLTDGSQNDFSLVTQWFMKMIQEHQIRPLWVGFDPWNSQYWIKEMEELGFNMEKVRQGVYSLSEPMKQLEADLKNKLINYDNNPILKWCLSNTQAKVDLNGNIQPSKLNSKYKRIDGTVALIIAYAVLNRYKIDYENMMS